MVCAPVRSDNPRAKAYLSVQAHKLGDYLSVQAHKLGDYHSVQAHKPCSISHIMLLAENDSIEELDLSWNNFRLKSGIALCQGIAVSDNFSH